MTRRISALYFCPGSLRSGGLCHGDENQDTTRGRHLGSPRQAPRSGAPLAGPCPARRAASSNGDVSTRVGRAPESVERRAISESLVGRVPPGGRLDLGRGAPQKRAQPTRSSQFRPFEGADTCRARCLPAIVTVAHRRAILRERNATSAVRCKCDLSRAASVSDGGFPPLFFHLPLACKLLLPMLLLLPFVVFLC